MKFGYIIRLFLAGLVIVAMVAIFGSVGKIDDIPSDNPGDNPEIEQPTDIEFIDNEIIF